MSVLSLVALAILGLVALYLLVGNLWHRVLAPLPPPDPSTFPRAGDRFVCAAEGVVQHVHHIDADGLVYGRAVLAPGAKGPPLHLHRGFDEHFAPVEGELHVQLADRVVILRPGETLHIPAGAPHRPFNPTASPVVLGGDRALFPQAFAATLVQLYRFMDERGTHPVRLLLQTSLLDASADTHLARVPRFVEPVLRAVCAPAARLLGYRNYYNEWALHPASADASPAGGRAASVLSRA